MIKCRRSPALVAGIGDANASLARGNGILGELELIERIEPSRQCERCPKGSFCNRTRVEFVLCSKWKKQQSSCRITIVRSQSAFLLGNPHPQSSRILRFRLSRYVRLIQRALVYCILTALPVLAENWPQWRGPFFNGSTTETNLPVQWSKTGNVAWATPLPGYSSATPSIWNGSIFVSSPDSQ